MSPTANDPSPKSMEDARTPEFLARVRDWLHLSPETPLRFEREDHEPQGRRLKYGLTREVVLTGQEFGAAEGVTIDEPAHAMVQMNSDGSLASADVQIADEQHLMLIKDHVRKLAAQGQIAPFAAAPDAPRDDARSHELPWHIEMDAKGRKRLKRAFMT